MSEKEFDLIVAGGGIAGLTAGLGSARAGLKTLVMTGDVLGGQLLSIERIDVVFAHQRDAFAEGLDGAAEHEIVGDLDRRRRRRTGAGFECAPSERRE